MKTLKWLQAGSLVCFKQSFRKELKKADNAKLTNKVGKVLLVRREKNKIFAMLDLRYNNGVRVLVGIDQLVLLKK